MSENRSNFHVPSIQTLGERYGKDLLWWYMFVVLFVGGFCGLMTMVGLTALNHSTRTGVLWRLGDQRISLFGIGVGSTIFIGFGSLIGWLLRRVARCQIRWIIVASLLGYWLIFILFNWPPSGRWITNLGHTTYYRHMLSTILIPIGCMAGPISLLMRPIRWSGVWFGSQLGAGFVIASVSHLLVINDLDGLGLTFFVLSLLFIYPIGLGWWFSYYLRRQIVPF